MKHSKWLLAAACAVVIGVYAYVAQPGAWDALTPNAADANYNLLVQGFRAGQLSLKKEVPLGLTQLADPYDPSANLLYRELPYGLSDLSYYNARLYLYFGVTPALILFWPYVALTGHYLFQRQAVVIFCALGFLASVGVLGALWQRYFAEVSVAVVAPCALALGLATGVPILLGRCEFYEVAISCGYMLIMLALGAIWCALHEPEPRKRSGWLAVASVAYGLAVGARPSLLFGAVILLVPVIQARHDRRQVWTVLPAAVGPIMLIGLGLMLYNIRRFGSPFELGQQYQLAGERQVARQFFHLRYLWFNFRVYFLEPVRWRTPFPFVHGIAVPPLPAGYGRVERPFGVLTNIPVVWLALAAPLAWRNRSGPAGPVLRWFVTATTLLFGMCALTVGFFCGAILRYEVDFLPALLLLAVVGILGLERALTDRPVWRHTARGGWGLLLGFSVAFNLLASVVHSADAHYDLGVAFVQLGRLPEAIAQYEQTLRLRPDYAEAHRELALALESTHRVREAMGHYERALRLKPDLPEVQNNLAWLLATRAPADGGDPVRAVSLAERACQLTNNRMAPYLDTLAAAYAAAGRFNDAVATAQEAIEVANSAGLPQVARQIEPRLELYRHGRAYYELKSPR